MPTPPPDRARGAGRGLLWLLLVALLGLQVWGLYLYVPGVGEPVLTGQDKLAHGLLFGLPAAVAALLGSAPALLVLTCHALLSEPLQAALTTTRSADPWDLVADLIGIALAVGVVWSVRSRRTADLPAASSLDRTGVKS